MNTSTPTEKFKRLSQLNFSIALELNLDGCSQSPSNCSFGLPLSLHIQANVLGPFPRIKPEFKSKLKIF